MTGMPKKLFLREAAKLAAKSKDGSYSVILIDEGEGSSGVYSADLLRNSEHVFENAPSFINHPVDPSKPHLRDLNTIAGRITGVRAEERDGKQALVGSFKPRAEYAQLFEDFGDIIGLSIFCGASGEELEDGRLNVIEFDADDPYRSVDAVVAAGRGGRFERAAESLRAIESSLGSPANKPAAEASAEEKEGKRMDEKDIQAIATASATAVAEALKPLITFVNESATKAAGESQAKVDAEALDGARAEGAQAAAEGFKAIDDAKLPAKIAEGLKAKVLEGKTVSEDIEGAKAIIAAVAESVAEQDTTYVIEGAASAGAKHDWSVR